MTGRRLVVVLSAGLTAFLVVGLAVTVPIAVGWWRDLTTPTLDDVRVYDNLRTDHIAEDESVEYDPVPPPGGPHDPEWLACGEYDEPVRDENAVHALEHGTVWITYDPDQVSEEDVELLADLLPAEGILSPYPDQPARVVVTVWERQLYLAGPRDERLQLFLDTYGDGHTAPEPMASCAGGVREFADAAPPGMNA